jgi:protein TonB
MQNGTMRNMTRWCAVSGGLHLMLFMILVLAAGGRAVKQMPPTVIDVELRNIPPLPESPAPTQPPKPARPAPAVPMQRNAMPPQVRPAAAVEASRSVAPVVPVAELAPSPPRTAAAPVMAIPAPAREPARPQSGVSAPPAVRQVEPDGGAARSRYLAVVRGMIEKYKEYPVMARRGRIEGTAIVGFVLTRAGDVKDTSVVSSSGSGLLDGAALRAVRATGGFPPVPAEISGSEVSIEVPLTFRLTGR